MWAPLLCKTFSWSPCEHPRTLQEAEKVPSSLLRARARPQNRVTAYLQWIMSPRGLLHRKYAVVLAVARDTVNMQSIGLASIYGAPSDDHESENCFFKKASQLRSFFLSASFLQSRWSRDPVKMQGFELAIIFVAPSDFKTVGKQTLGSSWVFWGGPNPFFTIPPSDAVWTPRGQEASRDLFWDLLRPHLGTSCGLS